MEADKLFSVLSSFHPLSDELRTALKKETVQLSLPANHDLIVAPKTFEHAYFIVEGIAMFFSYRNGKKDVERFYSSGDFIINFKSFLLQAPSDKNIRLLDNTEILCISYNSLHNIYRKYPDAIYLYQAVITHQIDQYQNHLHDYKFLHAKNRFKMLLNMYPGIEQKTSQENIASFLGISPQSLSRIKRENGKA